MPRTLKRLYAAFLTILALNCAASALFTGRFQHYAILAYSTQDQSDYGVACLDGRLTIQFFSASATPPPTDAFPPPSPGWRFELGKKPYPYPWNYLPLWSSYSDAAFFRKQLAGIQYAWFLRARERTLAIPFSYLAVLCAIYPVIHLRNSHFLHRRETRLRQNLCTTCGYDLRSHPPGSNCPECGTPVKVEANPPISYRTSRHLRREKPPTSPDGRWQMSVKQSLTNYAATFCLDRQMYIRALAIYPLAIYPSWPANLNPTFAFRTNPRLVCFFPKIYGTLAPL